MSDRFDFFSKRDRIAWPSGLRRWFKAPVTSVAWVRIPPLSSFFGLRSRTESWNNKHGLKNRTEKQTFEGDGIYVTQNHHVAQMVKYLEIFSVKSPKILQFLKCTINLLSNEGMVLLCSMKTQREVAI